MSKAWNNAAKRGWKNIRLRILRRDNYQCRLAIPGICEGYATQVHHTLGIAVTGHDEAYLVAACRPCNLRVGQPGNNTDPQHATSTDWSSGECD